LDPTSSRRTFQSAWQPARPGSTRNGKPRTQTVKTCQPFEDPDPQTRAEPAEASQDVEAGNSEGAGTAVWAKEPKASYSVNTNAHADVLRSGAMDKKLRRAYLFYNRKYFNNDLPPDAEIVWEQLPTTLLGYQQGEKIAINAKLKSAYVLYRMTLLHEMCHLHLPDGVKHGKRFQDEMRRLANEGAFDGLW
jgi:hypothetical protein